jgi:SAM-dependent methyltransferase
MEPGQHDVAAHYARGTIQSEILAALRSAGKNPERLTAGDLAAIDDFHIGGREATQSLLLQLALRPDMHVLDIGSGIGGPARYAAGTYGCRVTGIDLTDEFVSTANTLTRLVGLDDRVTCMQGDAMRLPFPDASFDAAYMVSVAMNIRDKPSLFAGVKRVLKPGAPFGICDVLRGEGRILYPLPWSAGEQTNFMGTVEEYRSGLLASGFEVRSVRDQTAFAIDHFARLAAALDADGPPPLGLHLILGPNAAQKTAHVVRGLKSGAFHPAEIVAIA